MRRAILPWIVVGAAAAGGCHKKSAEPNPVPAAAAAPTPAPPAPPAAKAAPAAPKPACDPLPPPDADHQTYALDLDGDQVADALVPTDCDGRENCTLHVFLTRNGCPSHLGEIDDVHGAPSLLPLTSHGVALVVGDYAVHAETGETVSAWDGHAFVPIVQACEEIAPSHAADGCTIELAPEAATVCLGGGAPAQTLDVDGDGTPDGVFAVPCAKGAERRVCGSWVLLARPGCLVPALLLPPGKVELATPAARGRPARLRVGAQTFTLGAPKGG